MLTIKKGSVSTEPDSCQKVVEHHQKLTPSLLLPYAGIIQIRFEGSKN